jgi:hypothetical protein
MLRQSASAETIPVWFRRVLLVLSGILAMIWAAHLVLALWAQNETAPAESIVALQSMMLARDGGLYYSNQDYPYTITAYTPIFYGLEAALHAVGIPVLIAGRLISFAAGVGIVITCWHIVLLYTRSRAAAWTSAILCAGSCSMPGWSIVGRVDPLALFFAFSAFHQYARHAVEGRKNALRWAGLLAIAAIMTKQTMAACPAAICLLLWMENKWLAVRFAAAVGGACIAVVAAVDFALHGRFLFNTVFANINPLAAEKLLQHGEFLSIAVGMLVVVTAAGVWQAARGVNKGPFVYLGCAVAVLTATAAKIGSDTNYHLETTILLSICAGLSLHALSFFPAIFEHRKVWVTLLQVPLAVHLVNNVRIAIPFLATRVAIEQQMAAQGAKLRKHLNVGPAGRVVSMDFNVLLHTRGRLDIEPLIYTLLVRAGRIDPEPLRRDLAARKVPVILLHDDATNPSPTDPEIPTLPESHLVEIRNKYELVDHIEGPYFGGVRVYKPKPEQTALAKPQP